MSNIENEENNILLNNEEEDNTKQEEDYTYEDRLQVPYFEKKKGDEKLKQNEYEEALKHFSKAIMGVKILVKDNSLSEDEMNKYINEVGVKI
jgi:hypothetical protein